MANKGGLVGIGVLLLALSALASLLVGGMFLHHMIGSWPLIFLGLGVLCYGAYAVGSAVENERLSELEWRQTSARKSTKGDPT
jgi:MFS family permease